MRKLVSLFLALSLVLSLAAPLAALADGEVQTEPARFVIRSNSNKENKTENEKIHKMIEELSGIKFEVIVVPENNWEERVNVMLAGGEEFDCINLTAHAGVWSDYAANGFLQPITEEMLDNYLPHVKAMIPDEAWVPCKDSEGKIWALPRHETFTAGRVPSIPASGGSRISGQICRAAPDGGRRGRSLCLSEK